MKVISLIIIFIILIWNTFASWYKLNSSDKIIVNKISSKIKTLLDKKDLSFRKKLESNLNKIQEKYKNNEKIYEIIKQVKINNYLFTHKEEYLNHYKNYYIDFNKVKSEWLSWHNKERWELNRKLYSYDERLDNTSYEWSKIQSKEKKIMSHKRNTWDIYYDYKKIEKWFNERWVKCKVKWWATTSESIWKFWYYCNDYNCTDELNKSLKEIFNIYMSEKWLWYPADAHYRWIVHKDLTKIWLWLRIEQNFSDEYENYRSYDYYVTTHYCTEFKN